MRGITLKNFAIISGSILGSLVLMAGGQSASAAVAAPALAAPEANAAHHTQLTKVWHRPWGWHAGPRWGWRQGLSYIADWAGGVDGAPVGADGLMVQVADGEVPVGVEAADGAPPDGDQVGVGT